MADIKQELWGIPLPLQGYYFQAKKSPNDAIGSIPFYNGKLCELIERMSHILRSRDMHAVNAVNLMQERDEAIAERNRFRAGLAEDDGLVTVENLAEMQIRAEKAEAELAVLRTSAKKPTLPEWLNGKQVTSALIAPNLLADDWEIAA